MPDFFLFPDFFAFETNKSFVLLVFHVALQSHKDYYASGFD